MSIQPVEWHDYNPVTGEGSPDTPIAAATLNAMQAYVRQEADRAWAAAEAAEAPTDAMVAGLVGSPSSSLRAALDGRYVSGAAVASGYVAKGALVFNVKDYGATGNGSTDDHASIQAAIAAANAAGGGVVYLPKGIYQISGTLSIGTTSSIKLLGAGRGITWLRATTTTAHMIDVGNAAYTSIACLSLTRSTRGTTGFGIRYTATTGEAPYNDLHDLHVLNQARGIHLGPATFGYVRNVVVEGSAADGIFLTNNTNSGALQWELSGILSQGNGGSGFRVFAQNIGATQITMGTWRGIYTFGNSSSGIRLEGGPTVPIHDFRLHEFFLGEDGDSEIFLETYGGMHVLGGGMIELCGMRTTGPTMSTPASNAGYGIQVGANNVDVTISGPTMIWSNSYSGIYVGGGNVLIGGGVFLKDNGLSAVANVAFHCGLYVAGGDVTMTGCRSHGSQYGAYTVADAVMWVANRLKGTVAATGSGVTLTASLVANNRTN